MFSRARFLLMASYHERERPRKNFQRNLLIKYAEEDSIASRTEYTVYSNQTLSVNVAVVC